MPEMKKWFTFFSLFLPVRRPPRPLPGHCWSAGPPCPLFCPQGSFQNRFGLQPGRGSLEGGGHLRLFMRSRASPAAHAHARIAGGACAHTLIVGGSCARVRYASQAAHPHAGIAGGACTRAPAHRRRCTRTLMRCTRTLIVGGSCAHVRRPSPAAHAHACIHVRGPMGGGGS